LKNLQNTSFLSAVYGKMNMVCFEGDIFMKKIVPIIIPSYEPDDRLDDLLEILVREKIGPVILVNDGSDEKYKAHFEKARELIAPQGGIVLEHEENYGKGRALKTAFLYCLNKYSEMVGVVTADSDGQHTPKCIRKVIDALRQNENSLILGVRDFDVEGVPTKSRMGNKLTAKVFKFFTGLSISDTQTGLRGIPTAFMKELLDVKGDRFEFETQMLVETKDRYEITEVKIETVYDSKENHTTHFNPFKDSIRIYKIFGYMFLKFLVSSLSSCVLDLGLFAMFCSLNRTSLSGVSYVFVSTVEARVISATYNFLVNYIFVFKSDENKIKALLKYASLAVVQMILSAVLTSGLVFVFGKRIEVVWKAIVDVLLFFISYYIQHEFVYRTRRGLD